MNESDGPAHYDAPEHHSTAADHPDEGGIAGSPSCDITIHITEEAERQLGGALYAGAAVEHHPRLAGTMPMWKDAHSVHEPQHGGTFFMAPNKVHHLEAAYSDACGFRLFLYNAFTKHIHVGRFQAFVRVVPTNEIEPELMRFLSSSADGAVLQTAIGDGVSKPFEIELYIKFPESEEPALFNIFVPASDTASRR